MERYVNILRMNKHRASTKHNYYIVWKIFNEFFIILDIKPDSWEKRLVLYVGFLISDKKKSTSIQSYISAIKLVLKDDGIQLNEDTYLLTSLMKACKYVNDKVFTRMPIQKSLVNLMLDETNNFFEDKNQNYLAILYREILQQPITDF